MQLEDFKSLWQKQGQPDKANNLLDEEALRLMLQKKATDTVSKINKSFLSEIGVFLILGLAFSLMLVWRSGDRIMMLIFIIVMVALLIGGLFMWRNYKRMSYLGASSDNLLISLQRVKAFLQQFVRQYIYLNTLNGVLFFMFGVVTGLSVGSGKPVVEVLQRPKVWYILTPVSLVSLVILYYVSRKVVDYVYGKHLSNLEQSLLELEEKDKNNLAEL